MKAAIMQPYLFPYIGYFSLIKNTDYFMFFDTPQYIRHGWINRNRILDAKENDIYFTVPIEKNHRETAIKDVKISYNSNWRKKLIGQLTVYKKRAPFYNTVLDLVREVIEKDWVYISELAIDSVVKTSDYLGLDIKYDIYSKMQLPEFEVNAPDEWALRITKYLGYDTYVNPPGGKSFFNRQKYESEGIELQFLTQELVEYNQRMQSFLSGLSILDVMMFCSPEEIRKMLGHYILE